MSELWETAFTEKHLMWGFEPAKSAIFARDYFARMGVKDVLIPGLGKASVLHERERTP